jgi:hypothetical protein
MKDQNNSQECYTTLLENLQAVSQQTAQGKQEVNRRDSSGSEHRSLEMEESRDKQSVLRYRNRHVKTKNNGPLTIGALGGSRLTTILSSSSMTKTQTGVTSPQTQERLTFKNSNSSKQTERFKIK